MKAGDAIIVFIALLAAGESHAINVDCGGADYISDQTEITVEADSVIRNCRFDGKVLLIIGGNVRIEGGQLAHSPSMGMLAYDANWLTVSGVHFYHNTGIDILFLGNPATVRVGPTITGNRVDKNTQKAFLLIRAIKNLPGQATDFLLDRPYFHGTNVSNNIVNIKTVSGAQSAGLGEINSSRHPVIAYNTVTGRPRIGIGVGIASYNARVAYNLVSGADSYAYEMNGRYGVMDFNSAVSSNIGVIVGRSASVKITKMVFSGVRTPLKCLGKC